MFIKDFSLLFNRYLSRLTSPTQILYATLIVGCILDSFYFMLYSSFVRSNAYTVLHFVLDILVAFALIIFYMDAVARDVFFADFESTLRPYIKWLFPRWIYQVIDETRGIRRNMVIRSYLLMLLFLFDCSIVTIKILCFGCLIYFRIHFALSFLMFIFFFMCLRSARKYNKYIIEHFSNVENRVETSREIKYGFTWVHLNQHPYHMVQHSVLPFITAFGTFDVLSNTVKYFHYGWIFNTKFHVVVGLVILITAVTVWLWSIVQESMEGHHTFSVRWNLVHGFILFIVSEVMLFFSIFWAFFHSSLAPSIALYCSWPPAGIIPILWHKAPLLNTSLLVISGLWLTGAHFALLGRIFEATSVGLFWTLGLGFLFTLVQAFEYVKSSFAINDSVFGSIFFLSTGFHGLHVIVGTIMLLVALARNALRHFVTTQHIGFSTAGWYWHFVDVVWLFLFISVYWWGGL